MYSRVIISSLAVLLISCKGFSGSDSANDSDDQPGPNDPISRTFHYKDQLDCYLEKPIFVDRNELTPGSDFTISNATFYQPIRTSVFGIANVNYEILIFTLPNPGSSQPVAALFGLDEDFIRTRQRAGFTRNDPPFSPNTINTRGEMTSVNEVFTYTSSRFAGQDRGHPPYDAHDAVFSISFENNHLVGLKLKIPEKIDLGGGFIRFAPELETLCLKNGELKH